MFIMQKAIQRLTLPGRLVTHMRPGRGNLVRTLPGRLVTHMRTLPVTVGRTFPGRLVTVGRHMSRYTGHGGEDSSR